MVRLSKIEVRMEDLEEYNALLKEEILASVKLEPGVLTLYAVCDKDAPNRITILEIYKDEEMCIRDSSCSGARTTCARTG